MRKSQTILAAARPAPPALRHAILVSTLLTLAPASAAVFGLEGGYPGAPPGPMQLTCTANAVMASNAALSVHWPWDRLGIRLERVHDEAGAQTHTFTGELFQIVLTNGRTYSASALVPETAPRVSEFQPDPRAPRGAARIPGRQVELPLRSSDGDLGVLWRVSALDGANYVRQEIEVSALRTDLMVAEIVWLREHLPNARTAGRVDGSPLIAGNLFLGSEDPHALNAVNTLQEEVGSWSPDDLQAGKTATKTWPLPIARPIAGPAEFVFQYERGPHRLDIWSLRLLENGVPVAQDAHHGWTGTSPSDNAYLLTLPALKPGATYTLAAELSTDPDFKLPAGGRVISHGRLFLRRTDGQVSCRLLRQAPLRKGDVLRQSFVIGVAPAGQMRRAFLHYLERERAHPYRPFLHYNSWYDVSWPGFPMTETNCLEAIRLFGDRFIAAHDVVMDAMVFDDGWDDPKTLWQFHRDFPNGFAPHAELCRRYRTHLGVWLSPFGGYGDAKDQRVRHGKAQGYEVNDAGFSLAGPKYYAAFKDACVGMMRRYGVNHFKFDGIASGMYANGPGRGYLLDTEAMRRLMLELRQVDPGVYINLTTGSWPSPFWLRFADSVWRQGGDMGFAGKGNRQQQWLTYRDQEVRRNIVGKGPLYPLNALMTQGVAWSRHGTAAERDFDSAGFKDDVRAFFGGGTSLQELYVQPQRLSAEDWRVLAEAARWARARAEVLVDTHWLGGDPARLEVYGYASWTPRQGVIMLRNPDAQPREFLLEARAAFELPPGAPTRYTLKSPWTEDAAKPALSLVAGTPLPLRLKPFEVVIFDALPAQ